MRKLLFACLLPFTVAAQKDYTSLVNSFIGTGGHGHTYPGASLPFGMMQLSPDTRMADWDGSSGYHYSDSVIYGFSHTHLSGTGIPDYCDLLMMPFTGEVKWQREEYRSGFSHSNEKASPGYYEVLLDKHDIRAQIATSLRSGMHLYSFPAGTTDASILIDLKHRDQVLESRIEKVNDYAIKGFRRSRSWAQNQYFFFYIEFERPLASLLINNDDNISAATQASGTSLQAALKFKLNGQPMRARVGISAVSEEGAKLNLRTEIRDWNFGQLRAKARQAWNKELSRIEVKGGTKDQQVAFYTALYHTMLAPNVFQDVDGAYRGTDLKIHRAIGFTNYTIFSLWDTYRALHPLMTIIDQRRTRDWINTFLHQYKNGGMLPVWELAGNETFCMIGYHSIPVITDAYRKGIRGFDTKLAMQAMTSYAESDRFGLQHYQRHGYLGNDKEHESVSKTLEYAYDDWCIAQFAKMTGNRSVYDRYMQRAQYYKNVFDPFTKHMRGKLQAMWYTPFDPKEINNFYTEGNSWQYSFAVPQDIKTLVGLHGGRQAFAGKLEELFTTSSQTTGRDQPDVTGLVGQYAQGNEPSHHMAYLFNYLGLPWKTQEMVHRINNEFYMNSPDGLIGNEDCGQMSAWFVFSALGFYPVCPGSTEYVLGTPLFDEAIVHLENGNHFRIKASRNSRAAFYVQRTLLNGKKQTKSYIEHSEIKNGGQLVFELGDKPNQTWGIGKADLPHSEISTPPIVIVPFVDVPSNKFRESTTVRLSTLTPGARIYYKVNYDTTTTVETEYTGPFNVNRSCTISFYAVKGNERSATVQQQFYRIPGDRSIRVSSTVHPMYTAGGPEALIDGILGTTNWKAGEWQSYFGSNLEAVIDLQQTKPVSYLGVHVLQDVSPWIVYPKEVIFYASIDGTTYTQVARVGNSIPPTTGAAEMQTLGNSLQTTARYIKVKVVNGGVLPAGHESAGNPSHLFIDEIIIK